MNSIVFWEGIRWRGQKVVTYSDTVNDDKMISSAITVHDKIIIILSQYMRENTLLMRLPSEQAVVF